MTSDRLQRCHYCAVGQYHLTESGKAEDPAQDHVLWGESGASGLSLQGIEPPFSAIRGSSSLAFGEYLAAQGDYRRAYQQFMDFAGQYSVHPLRTRARLQAGICLQKMGLWKESVSLFGELSSLGSDDPVAAEATFQITVSQRLHGWADEALRTSEALLETPLRDRVVLLNGWTHLRRGHWNLTHEALGQLSTPLHENIARPAEAMKARAAQGAQLPHRHPALAALFSALIPGSGKWYAGKKADGIYSLLLVSSSAAVATSYARDDHRTKAGLFGALSLFFYLGNIYGSALEAERFNQSRTEELLHDLEQEAHVGSWLWDIDRRPVPAQDLAGTRSPLGLAERMFQERRFDEAITEYRRHLFLFPEDPGRDRARYKIGLAHLNQEQWQEAREELLIAARRTASDSLRYRCHLRLGQSSLSQDLPRQSESTLRDLLSGANTKNPPARRTEVQFWLGVAALRQAHWVEAAGLFHGIQQQSTGRMHVSVARRLEQAALAGYRLPGKSPALAAGLSLIVPGSGQIYGGHIVDGLISLAFNAAAGYLTVDAFRNERQLDGMLLATLVWSRFYFGGVQNAARYAREYNRRRGEEHWEPYRELMKPEYLD
jgi:TolA-binding protein/TM2 domain-containing membrane protein YozV